jgi:hypothetical protein
LENLLSGLSQQTLGAWFLWQREMEAAASLGPEEPVAKKEFVPKHPEIPEREDYSVAGDEAFWQSFPVNLVSVLSRLQYLGLNFICQPALNFNFEFKYMFPL